MKKPLRVLIVEDSENDAMLLVHELNHSGFEPIYERVETPEEMAAALNSRDWELVLSDYVMPRFSGLAALKLLQESGKDLPFIVVSGKVGEDTAVDMMKAGAHDYILKGYYSRLVPAIERELAETGVRAERRRARAKIVKLNRLYSVLVEINRLIIRARDRDVLLNEACRIIVEQGLFRMAWAGLLDKECSHVTPVAHWGFEDGYLDNLRITVKQGIEGMGPTGSAIRTCNHFICQDIGSDERMLPWRAEAVKRGYRSSAAFPLDREGQAIGAFSVYSSEPSFFDEEEVSLLDHLAGDISYALQAIGHEEERAKAESALRLEVSVSSALLEASAITSACLDWDELTGKLLGLLHGIISSEACAILMLEDGIVVPQKAVGGDSSFIAAFPLSGGSLKDSGVLENAHDARKTLAFRREETRNIVLPRITEPLNLNELIISPIMVREEVVGFLCANFVELPKDPRVAAIIEGIAGQLGVAYENTRLYGETQKKTIELARKVETLKALSEIDMAILSTLKQDEMLSRATKQVRRIVPADFGCVIFRDSESGNFYCKYHWGWPGTVDMSVPDEEFPGLPAVASGKTLSRMSLEGGAALSRVDIGLIEAGVRSDMFIPITSKDKGVGLLYLGSRRVAGFSMEDVQTAERLANQIGIALENTKLVADLEETVMNGVKAFSSAIDAKSPWTNGHSERVTRYAIETAARMGLSNEEIETLRLGALLHDVGKIGTYDAILDKPDKLTDEEFDIIKKHPGRGCEILAPIKQFKSILPIIRHHHERMDGRGYPDGLKGDDIPLLARIVCVADSFDSMTADRPYRAAPGIDFAIREFKRCRGTQFDPDVVDAFLGILLEEEREQKAA